MTGVAPALRWTAPYYGGQHLSGHRLLQNRTYQVTAEDFGDWARSWILALASEHPFTSVWEEQFGTIDEARAAAEAQFRIIAGERP